MSLFGSAPGPTNPHEVSGTQYGWNTRAAEDMARLNQYNQDTPWGRRRFYGAPGSPGRREVVTLDPADQAYLDQQRGFNLDRMGMANVYGLPLLEQMASNEINYEGFQGLGDQSGMIQSPHQARGGPMGGPMQGGGGLAEVMASSDRMPMESPFTGASVPLIDPSRGPGEWGQASDNIDRGGGARPQVDMPPMGGMQQQGSPSPFRQIEFGPETQAWQDQYRDYRQDMDTFREAEDERTPVLPETVPDHVLQEWITATNPDKSKDLERFFRGGGLTRGEGGYRVEDLIPALSGGFSGASDRSQQMLNALAGYLPTWQAENATIPEVGERPDRPRRPQWG